MMDLTVLAPILLVLWISVTAVQSQIAKGPVNALKKVGESVSLECVTNSKNCDQIEWMKMEGQQSSKYVYKNGAGMLNPNAFPTQRYSVNSIAGCNLTITRLEISDSGRFSCVQTKDATQYTKGSVLVVINVTESCLSNVTNNALNDTDGYMFWTSINVPAKSVEPTIVTLSFQNKTANETETTDDSQPLTVTTTLEGKAGKANITQRVCRGSFPPNIANDFDRTNATLDVCTTPQLFVSYDKASSVGDGRPFLALLLLLFCVHKTTSLFIGTS